MVEEEEVVVGLEVVVVVVDVVVVEGEEVVEGEIASHFFHWQGFSILGPLPPPPHKCQLCTLFINYEMK